MTDRSSESVTDSGRDGSAASRSEFVQLRVPQDEHEALAMLTFWTRNAVEQAAKTLADGWSAEQVLAYATTDIKNVLSYIDRMSQQESDGGWKAERQKPVKFTINGRDVPVTEGKS